MSETAPPALGPRLTPGGAEFAVYSGHAEAVFVCLFDETGARETSRVKLSPDGAGVHRGVLAGVKAGQRYGLRVAGPFRPEQGHRFDVSKLLADPHALAFDRPFALHPSMFAFGEDSGPHAPKSVLLQTPDSAPGFARVAWPDTILYELNLRGFTRLREDVPQGLRGRFAALAEAPVIAHLKSLGVTTVELMPADAFIDERHLPPLGLTNAWGYNPVTLGTPDPRLAPEGWAEVRRATDALHAAGLEVVLDIVLNHNGESDEFGPTVSYRGLDNSTYFRLIPGDPARYLNDMGCGNCLALDRAPVVAEMVAALRRWMMYGGIDGFRFDLATALGRRETGFDPRAPLLAALAADPVLSKAKLIAEPWDMGPGGYQLGHFPTGWGEWNDRFRDTARRFWRGDGGLRGELATRLAGSSDVFGGAPTPEKSINFVVAHDGFTLADLVSYASKHNEANGESNRDGTNDNYSWNHGVEGPSGDPAIKGARGRDMRNLLTLMFVSRGAPMLAMGSETGQSQHGNNNAYAQDNAISWIDWREAEASLIAFVGRLSALRRAHPALTAPLWLKGRTFDASGLPDVEWRDADGPMTSGAQWNAPDDVLVVVFATPAAPRADRVLVAFNRGHDARKLKLPSPRDGMNWRFAIDTSRDGEERALSLADQADIDARTTLVLVEAADEGGRGRPPQERDIDALAEAAGIAADWWDVSGKHTKVSPDTKIALLEALRLPARSEAQARESLGHLMSETRARRTPYSLTLPLDRPRRAPLRWDLGAAAPKAFEILTEAGETLGGRFGEGSAERRQLADGRAINEAHFDLPSLPIGRHRLRIDGVECKLTIAPPEAYGSAAAWRKRFGVSAQLYALRRGQGDQGVGDFTTLGLAGAAAGRTGAAFLGVSPMHALFAHDRGRASPYHPSDRRFLEPFLIDALADDGLPVDEAFASAQALQGEAIARVAALSSVDYAAVWTIKQSLLRTRFAAFGKARAARPSHPVFADYTRFLAEGGEALQSYALFEAISASRQGEDWRRWPENLKSADGAALAAQQSALAEDVDFALFCQFVADRQLAAAAERARAAGLEIGLYRDLAVGAAPDGAESWSRQHELASGVSIGAPPDPFSAQGQTWHLPAPDPIAGAREGWLGLAALYGANMRHAGLLRIDHAMGLTRLFLIPDGATPAEGAYVGYPVDDLVGQIALESQKHRCMVVGEDLGTVPDGFRERLTGANIPGMRVLWFERDGLNFHPPADYPPLSVACATTHDLPTLAGWWQGADIAERLGLGLLSLADAETAIGERRRERQAIVGQLLGARLNAAPPDFDAAMTDTLAAAIHALLAGAGSALALAQFDDLAGETVATNLPGTDRERPNWRHRLSRDVDGLLGTRRAQEILRAMRGPRG